RDGGDESAGAGAKDNDIGLSVPLNRLRVRRHGRDSGRANGSTRGKKAAPIQRRVAARVRRTGGFRHSEALSHGSTLSPRSWMLAGNLPGAPWRGNSPPAAARP